MEFDPTQPYSLDLAYKFLNLLTPAIRDKCIRDGYNPPQNYPNDIQMVELMQIKNRAHGIQEDLRDQAKMIRIAVGVSSNRRYNNNYTRSYLVDAAPKDRYHPNNNNRIDLTNYKGSNHTASQAKDDIEEEIFALLTRIEANVCLTVAEKAMREASGERRLIECWKYTNDPKFHNNRFY